VFFKSLPLPVLYAVALLIGVTGWTGCGVKSTSGTSAEQPGTGSGSTTTTPIFLTLTDDTTSNGLVSFYANISQVQITPRNGSVSTLYSSASTLEVTHLAGSSHYLTATSISPDSYKNIIVTVTDPLITYINSLGATVTAEFPTFTGTAEIDFSDLLTVDTTPLEIRLDFNLEQSVVLDPATGVMTLTPTFTATALPIAATSPTIGIGLLETILATVSKSTASMLTINTDVAQTSMSCNITPATTLVNLSSPAALPQGSLVRVNMDAQRDSSITCARIEAINTSNEAFAFAGTVNSYRGLHSPYQLTLDMQEGSGAGVSPTFIGQGINVNFDAATFTIDWEGMDQTNIGFTPNFTTTTFFPAQYVEASSDIPLLTTGNDIGAIPGSMTTVAAMDAQQLTLRKQDEAGSVSNVTTAANGVTTFTLTPATNSVFATYVMTATASTTAPTITVIVPASVVTGGVLTATLPGAPAGSLPYVQVRGLLFLNGATYTLLAQRVTATLPPS